MLSTPPIAFVVKMQTKSKPYSEKANQNMRVRFSRQTHASYARNRTRSQKMQTESEPYSVKATQARQSILHERNTNHDDKSMRKNPYPDTTLH